jgi:hypothetical protein
MSAAQSQSQLQRKSEQRRDAENKAGKARSKESEKRTAASKARQAAARTTSATTQRSKLAEAERRENEANSAGRDARSWEDKAAKYRTEETTLQSRLARAVRSEADTAERLRKRDEENRKRQAKADRDALTNRIDRAETAIDHALRDLREPKSETLRVLLLGSSAAGDLRVGREQARIRAAVTASLSRDRIKIDAHPAATTHDLLDGLTGFGPHVVHFSGHSSDDLIVFEDDRDDRHAGVIVTAASFARAISAIDEPPLLVLLNACNSAAQIDELVERVVPFAIGMTDSIGDVDAINYAARFYAAVADGQSIRSSHLVAQAAMALDGLPDADVPRLAWASDVDPAATKLVTGS